MFPNLAVLSKSRHRSVVLGLQYVRRSLRTCSGTLSNSVMSRNAIRVCLTFHVIMRRSFGNLDTRHSIFYPMRPPARFIRSQCRPPFIRSVRIYPLRRKRSNLDKIPLSEEPPFALYSQKYFPSKYSNDQDRLLQMHEALGNDFSKPPGGRGGVRYKME